MSTAISVQDADELYARYGKPLEQSRYGEYLAIGHDGQVIVGTDDVAVVDQAIRTFGSGNFGFCRIGSSYVYQWFGQNQAAIAP